MAEYKILVIFVVVLFVLIGFGISWVTAVCFVIGALFSTVAGYCGMTVATKANVRTANAAKESGMNKALINCFFWRGRYGNVRSRSWSTWRKPCVHCYKERRCAFRIQP